MREGDRRGVPWAPSLSFQHQPLGNGPGRDRRKKSIRIAKPMVVFHGAPRGQPVASIPLKQSGRRVTPHPSRRVDIMKRRRYVHISCRRPRPCSCRRGQERNGVAVVDGAKCWNGLVKIRGVEARISDHWSSVQVNGSYGVSVSLQMESCQSRHGTAEAVTSNDQRFSAFHPHLRFVKISLQTIQYSFRRGSETLMNPHRRSPEA
jgi:hypothetical protein